MTIQKADLFDDELKVIVEHNYESGSSYSGRSSKKNTKRDSAINLNSEEENCDKEDNLIPLQGKLEEDKSFKVKRS